jgi:Protein of unknown function (DUF3037)
VSAISSYDYAVIRIVPSVERGECLNIGVILFCRTQRFLDVLTCLDQQRLSVLAPQLDFSALQQQLEHLVQVCEGKKESGPIGQLSLSERFHWLVSPRSTIIQPSPVHSGLCSDPQAVLQSLFQKLVL